MKTGHFSCLFVSFFDSGGKDAVLYAVWFQQSTESAWTQFHSGGGGGDLFSGWEPREEMFPDGFRYDPHTTMMRLRG
jgi:hypothetical protein